MRTLALLLVAAGLAAICVGATFATVELIP